MSARHDKKIVVVQIVFREVDGSGSLRASHKRGAEEEIQIFVASGSRNRRSSVCTPEEIAVLLEERLATSKWQKEIYE